jgi:integrase/recombinase XerD
LSGHRLGKLLALWLGEKSKTFAYISLYRAPARGAALAGIDDFHPHLLRHSAATRWLAAGGSEGVRGTRLVVQSLCGLGLVGRGPL